MNFMLQRFNLTCARVREKMDTCGRSLRAAPSCMFGTFVGRHPYVKTGNKSSRDQNTLIVVSVGRRCGWTHPFCRDIRV
jgi:hypothetical protein